MSLSRRLLRFPEEQVIQTAPAQLTRERMNRFRASIWQDENAVPAFRPAEQSAADDDHTVYVNIVCSQIGGLTI